MPDGGVDEIRFRKMAPPTSTTFDPEMNWLWPNTYRYVGCDQFFFKPHDSVATGKVYKVTVTVIFKDIGHFEQMIILVNPPESRDTL
jgi:hypothetical protein